MHTFKHVDMRPSGDDWQEEWCCSKDEGRQPLLGECALRGPPVGLSHVPSCIAGSLPGESAGDANRDIPLFQAQCCASSESNSDSGDS